MIKTTIAVAGLLAALSACGGGGGGQEGSPLPTPPANNAPSVPGGLQLSTNAFNSVVITWAASTDDNGVTKYLVFRGGDQIAEVGPGQLSATDGDVSPATTYVYSVKACDAGNACSGASAGLSVTTPVRPNSAPTIPDSVVANAISGVRIDLTWEASADDLRVAYYVVRRDDIDVVADRKLTIKSA